MRDGLTGAIDRRLEEYVVAWARRRWPALRLVPRRLIRPATAPAARRLRCLLTRSVLAAAMPVGIVLALAILKP
jgi:hypothetical protein